MLDSILKKLNLCRTATLDDANKTIEAQKEVLSESYKRVADLKSQINFMKTQLNSALSKEQELLSDISFRDEKIAALTKELEEESYLVTESKKYKSDLDVYKYAEATGNLMFTPCIPGDPVYWVSRGFDSSISTNAIKFDENSGYAIIELTVMAIIKNSKDCMVLMDSSICIDNMPSFHIEDFGKCVFSKIEDAEELFDTIIKNSTAAEISKPIVYDNENCCSNITNIDNIA